KNESISLVRARTAQATGGALLSRCPIRQPSVDQRVRSHARDCSTIGDSYPPTRARVLTGEQRDSGYSLELRQKQATAYRRRPHRKTLFSARRSPRSVPAKASPPEAQSRECSEHGEPL